jgi:hypothetical protein
MFIVMKPPETYGGGQDPHQDVRCVESRKIIRHEVAYSSIERVAKYFIRDWMKHTGSLQLDKSI